MGMLPNCGLQESKAMDFRIDGLINRCVVVNYKWGTNHVKEPLQPWCDAFWLYHAQGMLKGKMIGLTGLASVRLFLFGIIIAHVIQHFEGMNGFFLVSHQSRVSCFIT